MNRSEHESLSPPIPRHPMHNLRGGPTSGKAAFVGCKQQPLPPTEIAILAKKQVFSFGHKKKEADDVAAAMATAKTPASICSGVTGSSGRSIASSITCTELEVDDQDLEGLMSLLSISHEGQNLDSKPFIPTRQDSVPRLPYDKSLDSCFRRETTHVSSDSLPTKPRRSLSFNKDELDSFVSRTEHLFANKSEEILLHRSPREVQDITRKDTANKELLSRQAVVFYKVVEVKDRKRGILTFKRCFVGSEAVDAMLQAGLVHSRREAVILGQQLMESTPRFRHVTGAQTFKDKTLLYRFCEDKPSGIGQWFPLRRSTQARKSPNLAI